MRLRICKIGALALSLVVAGSGVAAARGAGAPPHDGDGRCTVVGDKVASPARLRLGDTVQVRLTLSADCPEETYRAADIVLVVDRSRSMLSAGKLAAAKNAARVFVQATDLALHQVAVVAFHAAASVETELTQDEQAIYDAIDAINIDAGTNISAAIDTAHAELQRGGRSDALPVMVLISDGSPNRPVSDPQTAARRSANAAKLDGAQIFSIGLGSDADTDLLKELASSEDNYRFAPSATDLEEIYRSIAVLVGEYALRDLRLDDVLAADVQLVGGTAVPAPSVIGSRLSWTAGLVPAAGLSWVYQVEPQRVGTYPTNDSAEATYTDADGQRRTFVFPQPLITVLDPSTSVPCDEPGGWTITVHSFPDSIGISGSSYPGCNNQFDSGDWLLGTNPPLPNLEYLLTDGEGTVLYRGTGVPGPGRVDQRLYIRVCEPPPYYLRLLRGPPPCYELCPNSPEVRLITERDFRPLAFRRTEERYGFISY